MERLVAEAEELLDQQDHILTLEAQEAAEVQLHLFHQVHKHSLVEVAVDLETYLADLADQEGLAEEPVEEETLQQILEAAAEAAAQFKAEETEREGLVEFI
jgi:protein-tyrosine-phosphatase